jgi:hypothetical protein
LLTAARFERLGHLNALRYGVAVERVMTVTDNRIEIAKGNFQSKGVPHNSCMQDMRHFSF